VLQRVKELNYIPNLSASALRTGQTRTMGLILPSMSELTRKLAIALRCKNRINAE